MTVVLDEIALAWELLGRGEHQQAAMRASSVLSRHPDNVSALTCHGVATWRAGGDVTESLDEVRRAVALAPDVAPIRHNLATLLASSGEMAEAEAQFLEALRIKPDDTLAFYGLTQNTKTRDESDLVRAMLALHDREGLDPNRREFLAYGLAKVFSDLGQPERAMTFATEANELGRRPFQLDGENRSVEQLRELAARDAFRKVRHSGHPSRAPLFIVGMNRSGTTLVESVLSRHSDVLAMGERHTTFEVELAAYRKFGPRAGRHELALAISRDWLSAQAELWMREATTRARQPFKIVTDKLPENAVRLGLIARLFPNARVIHVRRHPLDVGVSNFFQRFEVGQGYSTRLDWIGARTRQIADSMVLWRQALDLPILDVCYEQLVADPEGQTRRILAFAGLEWTPDCLEPHRTQRTVMTASQWQVRQPIYRGSVGRWKAYEPWLAPMIEAMGGFEWIDREVDAQGQSR